MTTTSATIPPEPQAAEAIPVPPASTSGDRGGFHDCRGQWHSLADEPTDEPTDDPTDEPTDEEDA